MKESKLFKELKKLKDYKITLPLTNEKNSNKNLDFNFFESYIGTRKKKKFKHLHITLIASTLTLVFLTSFIWNYIKISNTKQEIDQIKQTIDSPQTKVKLDGAVKLKKKYDVLNKYYAQAYSITSAIENRAIISSKLIEKICLNIPQKLSFKSFNITVGDKGSGSSIEIQGTAESRVSIAEFEHNLKGLNEVKEVQISNITELTADGKGTSINTDNNSDLSYSFIIKCTLKDVDEHEAE
ncbi:PilN domain-containing protein [Clostridium aciditolerans]|uniref:PilN domain-containing protein n=1 Tax=Clostridium aciditolerans TaxID=339861 RepID=A0A934HZC6_9CLOT|nr:PilN domain-containing protein [Clostridium aciditolerans]MBI6873862.1 PilN domain-containing protein [Clostridium aciditolerans]